MVDFSSIWNGDVTRVRVARNAYRENPDIETFVALVSALYSFRFLFWYPRELDRLLSSRRGYDFRLVLVNSDAIARSVEARVLANRCDVLSTAFEWRARKKGGSIRIAEVLAIHGVRYAREFIHDPAHAHTFCLLQACRARVHIARGEKDEAREVLGTVLRLAGSISAIADPNQRARVYTQLGLLLPQVDNGDRRCTNLGKEFAGYAIDVPGIGRMTRMKSRLAAWGIFS